MIRIEKRSANDIIVWGKFATSEEMKRAKELVKDLPNGMYKTNIYITIIMEVIKK